MSNLRYRLDESATDKVKKQIDNLKKICCYYNIPMFVTAAIQDNDDDTTEYYSEVFGAKSHNIHLNDDRIKKHILIQDGFVPVPPREEQVVDSSLFSLLMPQGDPGDEIEEKEVLGGEDVRDDSYEEELDCDRVIGASAAKEEIPDV